MASNINEESKLQIKELYEDWLKRLAHKILERRVKIYAQKVGVDIQKILAKKNSLKSRWASLTKNDSIHFNVHLMKAPQDVIDYIVLHEICHLKIRGHSHHYWALLYRYMPNYPDKIKWLSVNGRILVDPMIVSLAISVQIISIEDLICLMHKRIHPYQRKSILIRFGIILGSVILTANLIVVSLLTYFPSQHYSITVVALNVAACIASAAGIITVCRYGFNGVHGQSLLFLTLGIIGWFLADLTLAYGHFVFHFDEEQSLVVSFGDLFWIIGYVFLSLHLFSVLRLVRRTQIHTLTVIVVIVICGLSIAYNIIFPSELLVSADEFLVGETRAGFIDLALSILYVVLDLIFIIPAVIILTASRKDYYNFISWMLFSLSLLTNAIADEGFVHHFLEGSTKEMWTWDLFYITDYILIIGALYWYNRFQNSMTIPS